MVTIEVIAALNFIGFIGDAGANPFYLGEGMVAGLGFGYRRHLYEKAGIRIGTQILLGKPIYTVLVDSSEVKGGELSTFEYESKGSKGMMVILSPHASAIIGPFKRFGFEPGIGVTWAWFNSGVVKLDGTAGRIEYDTPKTDFFINARMAVSIFFGDKDTFNLIGLGQFGFYPDGNVQYQIGPSIAWAFLK